MVEKKGRLNMKSLLRIPPKKRFVRVIRIIGWAHYNKKPYLEETTKTDENVRLFVLPETLVKTLATMKEETSSNFVFSNIKGEPLKYNALQSAFNMALLESKTAEKTAKVFDLDLED